MQLLDVSYGKPFKQAFYLSRAIMDVVPLSIRDVEVGMHVAL
jgi:hypothetical protein